MSMQNFFSSVFKTIFSLFEEFFFPIWLGTGVLALGGVLASFIFPWPAYVSTLFLLPTFFVSGLILVPQILHVWDTSNLPEYSTIPFFTWNNAVFVCLPMIGLVFFPAKIAAFWQASFSSGHFLLKYLFLGLVLILWFLFVANSLRMSLNAAFHEGQFDQRIAKREKS